LFSNDDERHKDCFDKAKKTYSGGIPPDYIPRDNVVLEYGLFTGVIGREGAIIILCKLDGKAPSLPTDIGISINYLILNCKLTEEDEIAIDCEEEFMSEMEKLKKRITDKCQPTADIELHGSRLAIAKISASLKQKFTFSPLERSEIDQIIEAAKTAYDEVELNENFIKVPWFEKNRYGFWAVRDKSTNMIITNFTVLPITEDCYKRLSQGTMKEREITPEDIIGIEDIKKVRYLYIEEVCSRHLHPETADKSHADSNMETKRRLSVIYGLYHIKRMIRKIAHLDNLVSIASIGSTKTGTNLMVKLGFSKSSSRDQRRDGTDFYNVTKKTLIKSIKSRMSKYFD